MLLFSQEENFNNNERHTKKDPTQKDKKTVRKRENENIQFLLPLNWLEQRKAAPL